MNYILDFKNNATDYPYLEEINEGIIKQILAATTTNIRSISILDVGAGRATLGKALSDLGFEVYTIEIDPLIAEEARQKIQNVICCDLNNIEHVTQELYSKQLRKFDYVIFADILEHVYDPLEALRNYKIFLKEEGKIIVSLPNMLNWLNRLKFSCGIFTYEMSGVMDRTHIRFFTFQSAIALLKASYCKVEIVDSTPFLVRACLPMIKRHFKIKQHTTNNSATILQSKYYKFYMHYIYPIEYWICKIAPSIFAFRIILVASTLKDQHD